jgi:hypothetical protein
MTQRRITRLEIAQALNACEQHEPGDQPTTQIHIGRAAGRMIAVVMVIGSTPPVIVSTWRERG